MSHDERHYDLWLRMKSKQTTADTQTTQQKWSEDSCIERREEEPKFQIITKCNNYDSKWIQEMEVNKTKNYTEPLQKPISVTLSILFCSLVSLASITCREEKQFQRPHVFTLHCNLRVFFIVKPLTKSLPYSLLCPLSRSSTQSSRSCLTWSYKTPLCLIVDFS